MKLDEFMQKTGAILHIYYEKSWRTCFAGCMLAPKHSCILTSCTSCGKTLEESIDNFIKIIRGTRIKYGFDRNYKYADVPLSLER